MGIILMTVLGISLLTLSIIVLVWLTCWGIAKEERRKESISKNKILVLRVICWVCALLTVLTILWTFWTVSGMV